MIEIHNLSKHFGPIVAVDGVSFAVERGTVLGFLGPNGAGKSTTMKMLTGFLHPSGGRATVCGFDVVEQSQEAKRRIGYLPEGAPLYPDMTPAGLLEFVAEVRGLTGERKRARIEEVVREVNLHGVLHQRIDTLSKGYKRRVGLAQAIVHDPEVLVLDEPTDGLDPNQKHEVRSLIRSMARDKVIVLSTHILEEVEAVCSRVIIIAKGKVVIDCTPAELAARSRWHNAVTLRVPVAGAEKVAEKVGALPDVESVERVEGTDGVVSFLVTPVQRRSIAAEIGSRARAEGWEIDELRVEHGRLDEVFRELTLAGSKG
jgi:ABC-2 type transport system ATP-binding protein